jgi:hypothetical protein
MKSVVEVGGEDGRRPCRHVWGLVALLTVGLLGATTTPRASAGEIEVEIDLAGWVAFDFLGDSENTSVRLELDNPWAAPLRITGARWENLLYESEGDAWGEDLVLSLNVSTLANEAGSFWDVLVNPGAEGQGVWGPLSGVFGQDGEQMSPTGPFNLLDDGILHVELYTAFNMNGSGVRDLIITSGRLFVTYSAVPEPGSMLLLGCAAAGGIGWGARRRWRRRPRTVLA